MRVELPVELWMNIFLLAADDELIFANTNVTTAWHTSNWFKLTVGGVTKWTLRSPQDELALLQHRRTRQLKVCMLWLFLRLVRLTFSIPLGHSLDLQVLAADCHRVPLQLPLLRTAVKYHSHLRAPRPGQTPRPLRQKTAYYALFLARRPFCERS